jgi:hypothetical protein
MSAFGGKVGNGRQIGDIGRNPRLVFGKYLGRHPPAVLILRYAGTWPLLSRTTNRTNRIATFDLLLAAIGSRYSPRPAWQAATRPWPFR